MGVGLGKLVSLQVYVESEFTRSSQEILKHFTIRLEEHGRRKTVRYSICTLKRAELTFL